MSKREAFVMQLKDGCAEEYHSRHKHIWPELLDKFKQYGILHYSIFIDEKSDQLFAVRELADDFQEKDLKHDKLMMKWWSYNRDLMESETDDTPVKHILKEVFHINSNI